MASPIAELFAGVIPFVTVAELKSVTKAAQQLAVTPSAVSKALSKLERELGVTLLKRSPRAVALTHEGAAFYRECRGALNQVREARAALQRARSTPSGVLRVSLPVALGELVIMPALPRLLERYPGLSITSVLTDRYVDLASENFDVVVRIGQLPVSGLKRRRLAAVRFSTVASPSYLARHGVPHSLQDLAHHDCLRFVLPRGVPQPWQFSGPDGRVVSLQVSGTLSSDHAGGLLRAALTGHGLLQAHHYMVAGGIAQGQLVEVLATHAVGVLPMAAMFPASSAASPNTRAFIDMMVELLGRDRR